MHLSDGICDHTNDPEEMAHIIEDFWGNIWSRRSGAPSVADIDEFLSFYDKKFPSSPDLAPVIPDVEDIALSLRHTNDSAHGVDGVPFSAYRACPDIAAPIIHGILTAIGKGRKAPTDFNIGRLFIIPKDGSSTIDRTRPINVNNAINRICAKIITDAISPGLDSILDSSQQGFIPGRNGSHNVLMLNKFFYETLRDDPKGQAFILFLDTAKAFDSIDHDYLFSLLDKINMPSWVCNSVRSLFHDVFAFPSLSAPTSVAVPINRGVKQGCPLSPILFALAYDPLLVLLSTTASTSSTDLAAFADDLAVCSHSLDPIISSLAIIDRFAFFSGLGVNRDKTCILYARKPSASDEAKLASVQDTWKGLNFVGSAVYLGILMGAKVTLDDIYKNALTKLIVRTRKFARHACHISIQHKIIATNVFITPLFSYISQFFLLPKRTYSIANNVIRKFVISFNGGGFGYVHLTTPTAYFGFKQPLRDLCSSGLTALASRSKILCSHEGKSIAYCPERRYLDLQPTTWATNLIEDQRDAAAMQYLNFHRSRPVAGPFKDLIYTHDLGETLAKSPSAARKIIYGETVIQGWASVRWGLDASPKSPSLRAKFDLRGFPHSSVDQLISAAEQILSKIPDWYRDHHIKLILGALPTDTKRHRKNMKPKTRGPPANPFPCHFCGTGSDSTAHIYANCDLTSAARRSFHRKIGIPCDNSLRLAFLASPEATQKKTTNAVLIFNWIVWSLRSRVFHFPDKQACPKVVIRRIASYALSLIYGAPLLRLRGGHLSSPARRPRGPRSPSSPIFCGLTTPTAAPALAGASALPPRPATTSLQTITMAHSLSN